MLQVRLALPAAVIAVMLAGCGAVSNDAADDASDASAGAPQHPGGSATVDIGIPLAEGADAVATTESGPLTIVQYIVPRDRLQATIAFYDEWTAAQSLEYRRVEAATGGVSWLNAPGAGGEKHIISVLSPIEGDDFVTVTLSAGPAE